MENQEQDEILLSFGLCGNAMLGIKSEHTLLAFPRYDDCICQQLQTEEEEKRMPKKGCMYLTREWTIDSEAIVQQCEQIYQTYENAQEIIDSIYEGYHEAVVLDTGAYRTEDLREYVDKIKQYTGMRIKYQTGSGRVMKKLIAGAYQRQDQDIVVVPPGTEIAIQQFLYPGEAISL